MRNRFGAFFLAAALALSSLAPAGTADAAPRERKARASDSDQVVLVMTGVIGRGSYRQFRRALSRSKPAMVVIDGPGGILGEAMLIGAEVRKRGLSTVVAPNAQCASACAIVFLSGRTKYMGKGAAVGLHAASSLDGRTSRAGTSVMSDYLRDVGVPRSIVRRMAETAPKDIRWLTRSERRTLKIRALETDR